MNSSDRVSASALIEESYSSTPDKPIPLEASSSELNRKFSSATLDKQTLSVMSLGAQESLATSSSVNLVDQVSSVLLLPTDNAKRSTEMSPPTMNKQTQVTPGILQSQSPRTKDGNGLMVGNVDKWVWSASNSSNQQPDSVHNESSLSQLQSIDINTAVVDLVTGLISKMNNMENLQDIASGDTTSVKYVQDEMEKLTKIVTTFVEKSTGIVSKEGLFSCAICHVH